MNKFSKFLCCLLAVILTKLFILTEVFAAPKYVNIGTGGITGVYYPTGGAICRLVNRGRKEHGLRCSVESTGGSIHNLNGLRSKAIDFGIVQSDWQYHAYNGTGFFADQEPFDGLRSVLSLHSEAFTIAVLESSKIIKLDDIQGKIVNFGPQGSGMYATMEVLLKIKGWNKNNFAAVTYLEPSEQPRALCEGRIDVMIYSSGHPNGVVQEATQSCKTKLISIDKKTINKLIQENSFYVKTIIPGGMYSGNDGDVETFGVKATLVASEQLSDDIVYHITRSVFNNFDNFRTLHPVFSSLKKGKSMIIEGNSAPTHTGALRYYLESGMVDRDDAKELKSK